MSADQAFQRAEDEYFRLRGQFAGGRITREQFEAALKELMPQDAQGRYWMLGAESGRWYVHDGKNWTEAQPPSSAASPPPAANARPPARPPRAASLAPAEFTAPAASTGPLPTPATPTSSASATVHAPPARGGTGAGISWWNEIRQMGWRKLWPLGLILLYVLLTRNFTALIIGFAIAWLIRKYADRIDAALKPIWPLRDRVPKNVRKILAWVVPVLVSFYITTSLFNLFAWLPVIGPDASVFTFTALIAALIAYILIREPKTEMAQ